MKKNNLYKSIFLILIISSYFISIGFSAISVSGKVENIMASVKPTAMARITNILTSDSTKSAMSNSEDYNMNSIYGNINLPYADSTVTYKVNVTVFLGSVMKITDITDLNPNLEYELSNYKLGSALCNRNNECNFGATSEIYLTIKYKKGAYDSSNTNFSYKMNFVFEALESVAQIGSKYYETLQDAIDAVPSDNTKTTITLLKNTSVDLTVEQNKNIEFNFQNYTVSNSENDNVIKNYGTIEIKNGVITSNATFGAIDNFDTGVLKMTGGSIIATGTKQAIYNKGGKVEISGNTYLSSVSTIRATLHNLENGYITILGGTIVSEKQCGIENAANLTIGKKDGIIDNESIIIQGYTTGINSPESFNYYDGIVKGIDKPISDLTKIADSEFDYGILNGTETINSKVYKTSVLAKIYEVKFNANGGLVSEESRSVERNKPIGILPTPTRDNYYFEGWYTQMDGGVKINNNYNISENTELFAHWIEESESKSAKINNTYYKTLQEAIDAVPKNNTETTIILIHDISEVLTISKNQNIILDLQDNVMSNKGVNNVIKNNGKLKIFNGTITSNTSQGAINNNKGATLIMEGGSIIATGTRQAIYNDGGTLKISGDTYLSSTTDQRATLHNLNGGVVTVIGGTIISSNSHAIENTSNLTIGIKDGNITSKTPIIIGKDYGVNNSSTFNFYDGIIKGVSGSINGSINDIEEKGRRIDLTETIDKNVYNVTYLN